MGKTIADKVCACGKFYSKDSKFCSQQCYIDAIRRGEYRRFPKREPVTCHCGKLFIPRNETNIYCSPKCKVKAKRDKMNRVQCRCGNYFVRLSHYQRKHCSKECYTDAQRKGEYDRVPRREPVNCHCGKSFTPRNETHIYCSRECHVKARRDKMNRVRCRCGNYFVATTSYERKYCSKKCYTDAQHEGKYVRLPKIEKQCNYCGAAIPWRRARINHQENHKHVFCDRECTWKYLRQQSPFTGPKRLDSRGPGWRQIRREIRKRDHYICQHCGISENGCKERYGCELHVNHIIPYHQFHGDYKKANKPSNLESLCSSCHTKADAKWFRENPVQLVLGGLFER